MTRPIPARSGDGPPGGPPGDDPVAPRWLAFHVAVPDAAARASTWRALRDIDALNVTRGVWAVRDAEPQRRRLEQLRRRTVAAGGRATIEEVGDATAEDVILGSQLHRACERLWEDLANQLDWYQARIARGTVPLDERVDALTELTARFTVVVGQDIARSQGIRHAEARLLGAGADLVAELTGTGSDPLTWSRARPRTRPRAVEVTASFPLVDGSEACVARVHPVPDPVWEAAFAEFEGFMYQPSPERIPLRAGTFRWTGDPGSGDQVRSGLQERVHRFEGYLR